MFPLLDFTQLPSLSLAQRPNLPTCSAVYFALDETDRVLYIGQATNLCARWQGHHRIDQLQRLHKKSPVRLAWVPCAPALLNQMESHYIEVYNPLLNRTKVPTKRIVPRELAFQQMLRKIAPYVIIFGIVPATESAPALVSLRYIMRYGTKETTLLRRMIKANNRKGTGLKWVETAHRKDNSCWRTQCNGVKISLAPWSSIRDFNLLKETTRCNLAGVEMLALPPFVLQELIERHPYIQENFPGITALESDPIRLFWAKLEQTGSYLDKSIDPRMTPLSLLKPDATQ